VEKNEAEAPIGAQEDTVKRHIVLLLLGIFMASPALFAARGGRRGGSRHRTHRSAVAHRSRTASRHRARRSARCATCPRDKRGKSENATLNRGRELFSRGSVQMDADSFRNRTQSWTNQFQQTN